MSTERVYRDDEIRQIFERASQAEPDAAAPARGTGDALTLAQLQEIGREVGIPADRITRAALALAPRTEVRVRTWPLGVPIGVGRTADLPRLPTPREWAVLVAEIRETFDARGQLTGGGGFYEWRNGNLHVDIEPAAEGYRLRMGTRNGRAMVMGAAGLAALGWSAAVFVGLALTGDLSADFLAPTLASLLGAGSIGATMLQLPRWARTRATQMERIADRARELLSSAPREEP